MYIRGRFLLFRLTSIVLKGLHPKESREKSGTFGASEDNKHRQQVEDRYSSVMALNLTTESNPTILSDDELLHRMRGGDEEAFLALYRRRQGAIYRFAVRMSGSPSVAEDVTQETFMVLLRGDGKYDSARGSFSAYLFGIARNQMLRRLEKDRGMLPLNSAGPAGEEEAPRMQDQLIALEDPLRDLTRRETIESIRQAVLALPPHYREVIVLCDLHEMSYQEAAAVLECAVGTVRSRLHRGRGMLVERLRGTELGPQGDTDSVTCFV